MYELTVLFNLGQTSKIVWTRQNSAFKPIKSWWVGLNTQRLGCESDSKLSLEQIRKPVLLLLLLLCQSVLNASSSDSLLISVAGMAVYTGYVFMPQHIMAILHYFEVVQWHSDPAHLSLASCPSVHLPHRAACAPSPGLEVGIVPDHVEAELLSSFPKLIQYQRSTLEVMLDEVISCDCFSFTEIFKIVNNVGLWGEKKVCLISSHMLFLSL